MTARGSPPHQFFHGLLGAGLVAGALLSHPLVPWASADPPKFKPRVRGFLESHGLASGHQSERAYSVSNPSLTFDLEFYAHPDDVQSSFRLKLSNGKSLGKSEFERRFSKNWDEVPLSEIEQWIRSEEPNAQGPESQALSRLKVTALSLKLLHSRSPQAVASTLKDAQSYSWTEKLHTVMELGDRMEALYDDVGTTSESIREYSLVEMFQAFREGKTLF